MRLIILKVDDECDVFLNPSEWILALITVQSNRPEKRLSEVNERKLEEGTQCCTLKQSSKV